MAVIHQATIVPTKIEFAHTWLDQQPWAPPGETEMIGGYRFDDPAGEVGIEGLLVRRGEAVLHLPVTYRGAPLAGAEASLVTTMTHTALGDRWVYLAAADPVARTAYLAFLNGEIEQEGIEYHAEDGTVEHRTPGVTVVASGETGKGTVDDLQFIGLVAAPGAGPVDGHAEIVATWDGGSGVVALV